jgi:hypothetical protein
LRLIHYSAWIARRWDDPAFPMAFRGSYAALAGPIIELRNKSLMNEPA